HQVGMPYPLPFQWVIRGILRCSRPTLTTNNRARTPRNCVSLRWWPQRDSNSCFSLSGPCRPPHQRELARILPWLIATDGLCGGPQRLVGAGGVPLHHALLFPPPGASTV